MVAIHTVVDTDQDSEDISYHTLILGNRARAHRCDEQDAAQVTICPWRSPTRTRQSEQVTP